MRVVLDTNVMVAAIRSSRGASRELLRSALTSQITVLVSVALMLEYEAVMTRPEHLEAARITAGDVEAILDGVALVCEPVKLTFLWRPALRDPDDDMVLETAVNGQAEGIVTLNQRDFVPHALSFGLKVWTPGETWRIPLERSQIDA
jgi:putative PIN family toxin of toxin-antitoxin system